MLRFIACLCLVGFAHCEQYTSIDDLISSVFNPSDNKNTQNPPSALPPSNSGRFSRSDHISVAPNTAESHLGFNPCPQGDCVPYYQCANGTFITDGKGLHDIRIGEENGQTAANRCPGLLEICCIERGEKPTPVNVVQKCGVRNHDGIVFGVGHKRNEAQFGEFPWTVAILIENQEADENLQNVYPCGGSLIHPLVVMTAAHCVHRKMWWQLRVRVGEYDTQTTDEVYPHQDRNISYYVIQENYNKVGLFNDIALLFLEKPVIMAPHINTICLPPQDFNFDLERCFASGWGKDQIGQKGKVQEIMKRVELPVVPREQCLSSLRTTRLGKHFKLDPSCICAGGEQGHDTCTGDGGSPLVCPIPNTPNQYYQAGIVSWGIGCGGDQLPGVYVNVPHFRNWIDAKIEQYNSTSFERTFDDRF